MTDNTAAPAGDDVIELEAELARTPMLRQELPLAHMPADVEAALNCPPSCPHAAAEAPGAAFVDLGAVGELDPEFAEQIAAQLAKDQCRRQGHDLEVIETTGVDGRRPVAMMCTRPCGHRGYRVTGIGDPDVGALLTAALMDLWADLAAAYDRSPADPRESSIECAALITRIVDITRTLGAVPAEIVAPELVVAGLYVEVHRRAGIVATVAPCTLESARAALGERDAARGAAG